MFEPLKIIQLSLLLAAVMGSAAVVLWTSARDCSPSLRLVRNVTLAGLFITLALRLATDVPSFAHTALHGPSLLDSILVFPQSPSMRADEYGPGSFFVLGLISWIFGQRWEVVIAANQVLAVLTIGLVAWMSVRLTRRAWTAPVVVALAALMPALTRLAASEDAHNVAAWTGWLGLLGMDIYAQRRSRSALLLGFTAFLWTMLSRQTYLPWVLIALVLPLVRAPRLVRDRGYQLATLVLISTMAYRSLLTAVVPDENISLMIITNLLRNPVDVIATLAYHPMTGVDYALVSLPLLLFGLVLLARRSRTGQTLVLAFVFLFLLTLPLGMPPVDPNLLFRHPVVLLGLVPQALALLFIVESITWRPWLQGLIVALISGTVVLLPSWRELHTSSPTDAEYFYLRETIPQLPANATLAVFPCGDPRPCVRLPGHLLRNLPVRDITQLKPEDFNEGPIYSLLGVNCRARSVIEQLSDFDMDRDLFALLSTAYRNQLPPGVLNTSQLRPECEAMLQQSRPFGPEVQAPPLNEIPFILEGQAPVRIVLLQLHAPLESDSIGQDRNDIPKAPPLNAPPLPQSQPDA